MATDNFLNKKPPAPDAPATAAISNRVMAVILGVILLGFCVLSARWGIADQIAIDAMAYQTTIQEGVARTGAHISAIDANLVVTGLLSAHRLDPANPAIAEQLGGAYTLDVRADTPDGAVTRQWAKAYESYSLANVLRPSSPYAWANRAWTKYYLGQVDKAFYLSLQSAINLGPWEPEVQFVVVDLGFALWDEMPMDFRPQVAAMAQNGQRRYASQIVGIAQKRGKLSEVCKFEKAALTAACKAFAG